MEITIKHYIQKIKKSKSKQQFYALEVSITIKLKKWFAHRHGLFCLSQAKALPVEIGVQRVYDIGWQATVKKKPKNVVAVMSAIRQQIIGNMK